MKLDKTFKFVVSEKHMALAKRSRKLTQVKNLGLLATRFGQALRALFFSVLSKTDRFLTLNRYFLTGSTCTSREVEQKIHSGARPGYLRSEQQTKRNDTNQCEFKANTRYRNLAGKNERGTQIPLFFSFVAQVLKPITERFRITWTPN